MFCICENKDADQLHSNGEADQRLWFRHFDSTIPLLPKSKNFNPLAFSSGCTAWFVSDLVRIHIVGFLMLRHNLQFCGPCLRNRYGEEVKAALKDPVSTVKTQQKASWVINYRKTPKFSDARNLCCNLPKIQTKRPNLRVFCQNNANGRANSEDPDQTAPLGAVWSGSGLFAQTYLYDNLGSLQYSVKEKRILVICFITVTGNSMSSIKVDLDTV